MQGNVPAKRRRNALQPALIETEGEACPYPRPNTDLSSWERLTLSGGDNLLRVLRLLSKKFSWGSLSDAVVSADLDHMRAEIDYYKNTKFVLRPSTFFHPPKELPKVCLSEPFPLSRGEIVDLLFQSNFIPRYKPFAAEFSKFRENQKVHARMWRHPPGESLGTIIAVHGWFMGDQRVSALTMVPGFFFRLGLDVILYELPYHGRRAPLGNDTGALFPSAHVARTNEGFAQAIYELRSLAAWVKAETGHSVGTIGMSLGGYTAALWAALDKLAFVIPVVPLVSIADMARKLAEDSKEGNAGIRAIDLGGIDQDELEAIYAVHCPLSYRPKVPHDRRMIIAGLGDPVIPASQPEKLWEHWERPRIHWFQGGHIGQIVESDALKQVHAFLRSIHFAHPQLLEIE